MKWRQRHWHPILDQVHQHHIEHGSHADREDRVLFYEVKASDQQNRSDQLEVLLQAAGRDRFQAVDDQHRHDGEGQSRAECTNRRRNRAASEHHKRQCPEELRDEPRDENHKKNLRRTKLDHRWPPLLSGRAAS